MNIHSRVHFAAPRLLLSPCLRPATCARGPATKPTFLGFREQVAERRLWENMLNLVPLQYNPEFIEYIPESTALHSGYFFIK